MMRRFFATMVGQVLAIIAVASMISQLLFHFFINVVLYEVPPPPPWPWPASYRIVSLVGTLRAVPDSAAVMAASNRPDMSVSLTEAPVVCEDVTTDARELELVLRSELREVAQDVTVRSCADRPVMNVQTLVTLGDRVFEIRTSRALVEHFPFFTFPFVTIVAFICVGVAAMQAWAAWRVIGPLRRLSAKADAFGGEVATAPIEEEGPLEIQRAARAFNLMQERVTRSIRDRTRMLAAVSHDLRTPLTRMRLQLEAGQVEEVRGKLLRDVGVMQSMVSSALAFLSGSFSEEDSEWFDLGALLSTLCDEFEEAGATIGYQGPEQIRFFCRPNAINRALTNVIENATHFGHRVEVRAATRDNAIVIDVADDGPGIPAQRVEEALEPFVRLDRSRSSRQGSVGLGLSIVKEIVALHNGKLELLERKPQGLIVRMTFPTATKPDPARRENAEAGP